MMRLCFKRCASLRALALRIAGPVEEIAEPGREERRGRGEHGRPGCTATGNSIASLNGRAATGSLRAFVFARVRSRLTGGEGNPPSH